MDQTKKLSLRPTKSPKNVSSSAELLIAQAIDKNVPVETMERLLAMRRELKAEKAKEDFDLAMARFQADCPIIEKLDKAGAAGFQYKYATLDHIVKQVKGLLAKNGFSYTFDTRKTPGALTTFCKVKHKGGHMEVSEFEIAIDTTARMNISQKDGSASSYGKRYAFCNAFGILTGDEDTDAITPKEPVKPTFPEKKTVEEEEPKPVELITPGQNKMIFSLLSQKGKTKEDLDTVIKAYFKKDSLTEVTKDEAKQIIERLMALPIPDDLPSTEEIDAGIEEMRKEREAKKGGK